MLPWVFDVITTRIYGNPSLICLCHFTFFLGFCPFFYLFPFFFWFCFISVPVGLFLPGVPPYFPRLFLPRQPASRPPKFLSTQLIDTKRAYSMPPLFSPSPPLSPLPSAPPSFFFTFFIFISSLSPLMMRVLYIYPTPITNYFILFYSFPHSSSPPNSIFLLFQSMFIYYILSICTQKKSSF